ncbi:MAG TPA: histidine--tRNA ligase [Candidatus Acidoferrales bacterium]|nr:histidine--tRNA ligase [Candidatus Acidoferrales bacterium]
MKIPSVKGFHDILPDESARWSWMESQAREQFARYGFAEIRIPIVERTELFSRSIGETTDIVEKEMYSFADRDGSSLTLRPEGTASIVRAYVEHALAQHEPVSKLFYLGPMFRRERPQKGRLRQFSQIGAEVIGRDDAAVDAEVLLLLHDLLAALHIRSAQIELNSLGDGACRPAYRAALQAFGEAHRADLCENCQRRLERNPLRLLDCKDHDCHAATKDAPLMIDHLCGPCRAHFDAVRGFLTREGLEPRLNPRMVRGLDYYCRTAFEVVAEGLGAQNAVGGGGRYDGLVKALGGPDTPGIGFALGVERLILSMAEAGATPLRPEVFIAPLGAAAESEAIHLAHRWRRAGVRVEMTGGGKSLKSQMRMADKSGARYVVILGEDELAVRALTVRDMTAKRDFPRAVDLSASADGLRAALAQLGHEPVEQSA